MRICSGIVCKKTGQGEGGEGGEVPRGDALQVSGGSLLAHGKGNLFLGRDYEIPYFAGNITVFSSCGRIYEAAFGRKMGSRALVIQVDAIATT